jgi:hypothetical protein
MNIINNAIFCDNSGILDAGYWMLGTGYWMLNAGCWLLDT